MLEETVVMTLRGYSKQPMVLTVSVNVHLFGTTVVVQRYGDSETVKSYDWPAEAKDQVLKLLDVWEGPRLGGINELLNELNRLEDKCRQAWDLAHHERQGTQG